MPPPDASSVEAPETVEELKRHLHEERAIQRVLSAVLRMNSSREIAGIARIVWEELQSLGYRLARCSISIFDEAHDYYGGYHVVSTSHLSASRRAEVGLEGQVAEPALEESLTRGGGPFRRPLIEAWRRNEAFRYSITSLEDRKAVADHSRRAQGLGLTVDDVPPSFLLYVPFEFGVVGVASFNLDPAQFSAEDEKLLHRFGDAFAGGYRRFLEMREREIQRAVEHLRAEVASMRNSADIVEVITELGQQLAAMGLKFDTCSISVIDQQAGLVRMYNASPSGLPSYQRLALPDRIEDRAVLTRIAEMNRPVFVLNCAKGFNFFYATEPIAGSEIVARRSSPPRIVRRTDQEAEAQLPAYRRRWQNPGIEAGTVGRSVITVPFSHGRIAVVSLEPGRYIERDVGLVTAFAGALSLGFVRYLDFESLERRKRELELDRAVHRVQLAVQAMRSSTDLIRAIPLVAEEIRGLGVDADTCSISIVDRAEGKVRVYVTGKGPLGEWIEERLPAITFDASRLGRLELEEGPIRIAGIPDAEDQVVSYLSAPLDSYHGRIQQIDRTTIISRTEEELRDVVAELGKQWKISPVPEFLCMFSVVRAPFSGGTIALQSRCRDHFSEREARILERLAEAVSLGYTRYLDFRRLEEQNRALDAASRLKSDFLANMSHEIRTPMNAVINFTALILDGAYGPISDELRDAVEEIDRNGEALLSLINDLLDLSKIEAGAMKLQLGECSPEACVDMAIAAQKWKAAEKGLTIRREVEAGLPVTLADERRITQQVLTNLLRNAIKFTSQGEIRVGARRDGGKIVFWVADTGIGIPKEEHERIFESFRQVDGSLTREAEGTGLGLTIARKFVEMHGGRIWLESEPGRGSRFEFSLPLREQPE
jgi:signal transduction histidine kinase